MKDFGKKLLDKWYLCLVGGALLLQVLVFVVFRDESYIQVHDNLDLFMAHYQMIKLNNAFFSHNVEMPMLHGISRDLLGSEFLLYNFLYVVLPGIWAYLVGYALKIAIGAFGFILLAKDVYKDSYDRYKPIVIVVAVSYGMIPVFPTYGIAFTSIPLIIWLLRRLYFTESFKKRLILYVGVFCYPIISYFSYHGFFILCYMVLAFFILWIRDKKFPKTMCGSLVVLSAGYILWEYRLFAAMLFDDTVTIRTTMEQGNLSFGQSLKAAFGELVKASFHSQDSHTYIILLVALVGIIVVNIGIIKNNENDRVKKIFTEPVNLVMFCIIFNVLIYGLSGYEPFRHLLETIVPKLTGFDFGRTAFLNPFLWYVELFLIAKALYEANRKYSAWAANTIVTLALVVVMLAPAMYNDFYYTCYNHAYKLIKHKETSTLNYREFYSEDLFEDIKSEIGYNGEWSVAYGIHPAVLIYNGISAVDGYLGMYSQDYKEKWQKILAPALEGSPSHKDYFDSWGARVNLYSGSDENTYAPLRNLELEDERLMVDMDELKSLDCKYIFSRIQFSNADEYNLKLVGEYEGYGSPYTIYVFGVE